ncbi:MAG: hypothetical protein PHV37_03965 [Candidatus Gastranaerophilales bacterium]|nr:hypothetical protein [Candidatus Gastranaerophilales bacterium]
MKKLSVMLCTFVLLSAASYAACPLNNCATPKAAPCCETPKPTACEAPKPCCDSPEPCCQDDKPTCCNTPDPVVIKQESCCWGLSQTDLFKKLCLDKCQMDKACCLYNKYKCDVKELKEQLKCKQDKLCEMVKCGASCCDIKQQKKDIKCLKKDIKEKWATYQDDFKCMLTKDQKKNFNKFSGEENKKYKQLMKNKCCCKLK